MGKNSNKINKTFDAVFEIRFHFSRAQLKANRPKFVKGHSKINVTIGRKEQPRICDSLNDEALKTTWKKF